MHAILLRDDACREIRVRNLEHHRSIGIHVHNFADDPGRRLHGHSFLHAARRPAIDHHHCRVGILNEIGELLNPRVVVLLIGERPGLATAESLSAYMAYQPRASHTDANRNLISNIHSRGLSAADAASRILNLAAQMMHAGLSGYTLREGSEGRLEDVVPDKRPIANA